MAKVGGDRRVGYMALVSKHGLENGIESQATQTANQEVLMIACTDDRGVIVK